MNIDEMPNCNVRGIKAYDAIFCTSYIYNYQQLKDKKLQMFSTQF